MRVDLGLHVGSERRESVERLGPRPLALPVLDRAIADVLRGGVAEDVARGGGGRDVAHPPADDHRQLGLEIRPVRGEGNLNLQSVGDERRGRLEPEERFLRQRLAGFARVVGVIEAHGDDLGGVHRGQGAQSFEGRRLLVEGRRAEDVAVEAEQFAVHNFGVENFVTLLESADSCHKSRAVVTNRQSASQAESRNNALHWKTEESGSDASRRSES